MNIYDNFMNDLVFILMYQFIYYAYPIWFTISILLLKCVIIKIKKTYYIPYTKNIDLINVVITYDNYIIFTGLININYYHLKFKYNRRYVSIIGNNKYIIDNLRFYRFVDTANKKVAGSINIILLPIQMYPIEECCICYENEGILVGLCGHQNVCKKCIENINKCPICNNMSLCKYITIKN